MGDLLDVLIYEPAAGGHHFVYLQHLLDGLVERECSVRVITSAAAVASVHAEERLGSHMRSLLVAMPRSPPPGLTGLRAHVTAIRSAVREHSPRHLLLPYMDGLIYVAGCLPRSTQTHGILFSPNPFRRPARRMMVRGALSLRRVARIHHLDESVVAELPHRKLQWLADPVESVKQVAAPRELLGLPAEERFLLVAGVLTRRKGIREIFSAMGSESWPAGLRVRLAGTPDDDTRRLMEGAPEGVTLHDEPISDVEFPIWFQAADIVAATYPSYLGSSGVVLNAAAAGTTLVVHHAGWIADAVARHGLGQITDVRDPSSLGKAIAEALRSGLDEERAAAFVSRHSVEAFQEAVLSGMSRP